MYESFFQLKSRPFTAAPMVDRYFPAATIEEARQSLSRAVDRSEGPGVLIGSAGMGKSLLCQLLAHELGKTHKVAFLASARLCTRRALLQNVLFELGLPYREREEGELRLTLMDYLEPTKDCPNGIVLIIDEAHTLPLRLLEEIRMLSNFARDGQTRVQVIVAGGPALEERFAHPKLESFNQRIAVRSYLQSYSREETYQYVRWHLEAAGGEADEIVDESALDAVHVATDGIPRLINQVLDHALLLAAANQTELLTADTIQEAWADLQQLPAPWTPTATTDSSTSSVVEFGELSPESSTEPVEEFQTVQPKFTSEVSDQADVLEMKFTDEDSEPSVVSASDVNQFVPNDSTPEVELVFAPMNDPFGGEFEQEEVVIDKYATLEAESLNSRTHVSGDESKQIAAAIQFSAGEPDPPQLSVVAEASENDTLAEENESIEEQIARSVETLKVTALADNARAATNDDGEGQQPQDDRDIIVIAEPKSTAARRPQQQERSRPQNYRRLFAKLRNA